MVVVTDYMISSQNDATYDQMNSSEIRDLTKYMLSVWLPLWRLALKESIRQDFLNERVFSCREEE